MRSLGLVVIGLFACAACVGDSPLADGSSSGSSGSSSGQGPGSSSGQGPGSSSGQGASSSSSGGSGTSSSGGGSSGGGSSSGDASAPVVCTDPQVDCQGTCVALDSSGDHCGACGHSCGGGLCANGACQPMVVRDGLSNPVFGIDATTVFFSQAGALLACPLAGCSGSQPRQVGALPSSIHDSTQNGPMVVTGGNAFFMVDATSGTSGPNLDVCPTEAGCATPPPLVGSGGHQSFGGGYAGSGNDFYWTWYKNIKHVSCTTPGTCVEDAGFYAGTANASGVITATNNYVYFLSFGTTTVLQRCGASGVCTPSTVGTIPTGITKLRAQDSKVWILATGGDGYTNGSIRSCPSNSSSCSGDLFAGTLPYPTDFTVDANAISWLNRDATGNAPPASIVGCPLGGCNGGPRVLAAAQDGAHGMLSDDGFVYWATGTQILRVAK